MSAVVTWRKHLGTASSKHVHKTAHLALIRQQQSADYGTMFGTRHRVPRTVPFKNIKSETEPTSNTSIRLSLVRVTYEHTDILCRYIENVILNTLTFTVPFKFIEQR